VLTSESFIKNGPGCCLRLPGIRLGSLLLVQEEVPVPTLSGPIETELTVEIGTEGQVSKLDIIFREKACYIQFVFKFITDSVNKIIKEISIYR
jgi:hypothetical protein